MDLIEEFMNAFIRYREEKQAQDLYRLFDEGPKSVRNVPDDERALALQRLLSGNDGILAFLQLDTDERNISSRFATAYLEAIHFLQFIIIEYIDYYRPHAIPTMNCCTTLLTRKGNFYMKRAACYTCTILLKNFPNGDFHLQDIIEQWLTKIKLYSLTDVSLLLRVMSSVAYYQPDVLDSPERIKNLLINHFFKMYETTKCIAKDRVHCLNINIQSMDSMFHHFSLGNNEGVLMKFYQRMKHISEVAESNKDNKLITSILNFMNHQMEVLKTYILSDHQFWHEYFTRQSNTETNGEVAFVSLQVYYEVLGKILYEKESEQNQVILQGLNAFFRRNIIDECLSSKNLRLSINGYSRIAQSVKKQYSDGAVVEMYSTIARRTLSLYFSEEEASEHFEDIADYQEALSRIILQISHVTSDQIKQLIKLCIIMIKRFPELSSVHQGYAINSLKKTVCNIESLKVHVSRELITNIIFEGIVWSCSHSLLVDAELKQELENLPKRPICYKDYVPLWRGLLDQKNYPRLIVPQQITKRIIETCIELLQKLNLRVKTRENNIYSDLSVSQIAENETDYRIFLNLVDLYSEILDDMDLCLNDKFSDFLYEIIRGSYKHPLISGFYRLVDRTLNVTDYFQDQNHINSELCQMVLQYLQNMLDSVCQYPHELQINCVRLILHIPMIFASRLINETVPIFKIALTIGLNDYELANSALESLEKYLSLGTDEIKYFLKELMPSLELYLRSKKTLETCVDLDTGKLKTIQLSEGNLEKLQRRILLFFGRVDYSVTLEFLHEESLNTGVSWDKKDLLKYSLNLPDVTLDIYLDTMLPRVVEVALTSSDRRIKLVASELVHSIVAIVLGKTVQFLSTDVERLASFYKMLCPAILRLGCDTDEVIRRLHSPLMLQLTHWLSSKLMLHSPAVIFLVDALFDGLSNETDFALRDFSGICLAEFVKWTIKQSSDYELSRAPVNINTIVESITNFALHPSRARRIAAAIAFNYLSRILSENREILNIFWFQLFYSFVKSMDDCNDISMWNSLEYIKMKLIEESRMFNIPDVHRKIPEEFTGSALCDALCWLLSQCGVLDKNARSKFMMLFESLTPHVTVFKSTKSAINHYVNIHQISGLNKIILRDLDDTTLKFSSKYFKTFLRTLDCYIWLIHNQLIDYNLLFSHLNESKDVIFNCINNFTSTVSNTSFHELAQTTFRDEFKINTLQCEIIMLLFDFILEILNADLSENRSIIHQKLFNENTFTLISRCLLEPRRVGFDLKNISIMDALPNRLVELVKTISTRTSSIYVDDLINQLNKDVLSISPHLLEIKQDDSTEQMINLSATRGLQLLQKCHIFDKLSVSLMVSLQANGKMTAIFNSLKLVEESGTWCVEWNSEKKLYLAHLLEIHLNNQATAAKTLIEHFLTDRTHLQVPASSGRRKILHGEYFFNTFRNVIIRCLLSHLMETLTELTTWLEHNPDIVFFIMEQLAIYLQEHKTEHHDVIKVFVNEMIERFNKFERVINNIESRKQSCMNIYRIIVRFKDEPLEISKTRGPIYVWILNQLTRSNDLSTSACILNDFLICLVGENTHENFEMNFILLKLKNYRGDINNSEKNSLLSAKAKECYQVLLTSLPVTKSHIVFRAIIDFSMGAAEFFCNEATTCYLKKYFSNISPSNVLISLEVVFRLFMDTVKSNERFDVLIHFLLPSIKFCSPSLLEEFFNENVTEIFKTIWQLLPSNPIDCQKLLISQIGCYNLIELMFTYLELTTINEKFGDASREILQHSTTGLVPQRIFHCTLQVRKLKTDEQENKDILRKLHCATLNCCIAMASSLKEEKYYLILFAENVSKDQMIWKNIVDGEKKYHLAQTFKEFPKKRRALVNIKKSIRNDPKLNASIYSYLESYNLASSTLTDNIYAYDFNDVKLLKEPLASTTTVTLEVDDLNNHECMPSICAILNIMFETDCDASSQSEQQPPMALRCFAAAMNSTHINARLFMLKIILNNQAVFKPFAEIFLLPIINIIILILKEGPLNYVLTDALLMLIDWAQVAVPLKYKSQVEELFSCIIDKVDTLESTKYIVRYNFSVIELLVKVWHECVEIPQRLNKKMKESRACAIRLVLIFLSNKTITEFGNRDDIWEFLITSMEELQHQKEDTFLQTSEAIGLFLKMKYCNTPENLLSPENSTLERIRKVLRSLQESTPDRLVKCVHSLSKVFPILSQFFFEFITHNHLKVGPPSKALCMKVFLQKITYMTSEDIVRELNYMKFNDLLRYKVLSCEKICLEIIEILVPIFNATEIFLLADLASAYSEHEDVEYRKITYNIFMNIYKKYVGDITQDYHAQTLIVISKKTLLPGLLDPVEELQQKVTTFWTEEADFGDKSTARILNILDVYLPDVEKNFLPILTLIFLDLIKKSSTYQNKMFEPLTHSCCYKNYKIAASWRVKNLTYKIPLFAPSYASQYSRRYTLSSLTVDNLLSTDDELMLRATHDSEFEPIIYKNTTSSEESIAVLTQENFEFVIPELPSSNIRSRRFLGKLMSTKYPESRRTEGNYTRHPILQSRAVKEHNAIKLNRTYRIGDLPDIEITHESFVNPLLALIKLDRLVCKNLAVAMILSLLKQIRDNAQQMMTNYEVFMNEFRQKLNYVLENCQGNGLIIAAILEVLFHIGDVTFNSKLIRNVSKVSGFNCLGALLLERRLIIYPEYASIPPPKRCRRAIDSLPDSCSETDDWIQLAELYDNINEVDISLSIFLNHVSGYEKLHEASAARAVSNWNEALDAYRYVYESESDAIKNYSHQAMIECFGRLSDWDQIYNELKSSMGENDGLDDFLKNTRSLENGWISMWFFRAGIYQALTLAGDWNECTKFVDDMNILLVNPHKAQRLKELFGEEIAAMLVIDNPEKSQYILHSALDNVRDQWNHLSPLFASMRTREVIKMRGICNVDVYGKIVGNPDKVQSELLEYWNNSIPHSQDDLLPWDYHTAYRSHFVRGLVSNIDETIDNTIIENNPNETTFNTIIKLKLRMIEVAFQQKNKSIMNKYLNSIQSDLEKGNERLRDEFTLNVARYRMLRGEMSHSEEKLRFYYKSWTKVLEIPQDNIDVNTLIAIKHFISDFLLKAIDSIDSTSNDSRELIQKIDKYLSSYKNVFDDEFGKLYSCSFDNLMSSCTDALCHTLSSNKIADCHLKLLKFCNDRINVSKNLIVIKEFVRSTFRALSHGSRQAAYYFPCLLNVEYFDDMEVRIIFIEESDKVPCWRFLMWRSELLLHLLTPLEDIMSPIVRKLLEQYPNAMIYTLHTMIDTNPEIFQHPIICKYKQYQFGQSEMEKFIKAMQYLVRPELYLRYYLNILLKNIDKGKSEMVDMVLMKVYPEPNTTLLQGNIYKSIACYRKEIEQIKEMPESDIEFHILKLQEDLHQMMRRCKDSNNLRDYSPYLSSLNASNIEIPGQYTGEQRPNPENHTKIAKIDSKIAVMKSSRKPIKITFIGNDGKTYNFLVKFGEDLRLDEKVEQAFGIMNEILKNDIACSQRYLSIDTYQVITFSGSFGLIQWIDNTKTLQDFINFTLNDEQKIQCNMIRVEYENWISNASSRQNKLWSQYKEALIKYDCQAVKNKMTQIIKKVEWDLLRRTFLMLSPSLESFMASRRNFMMTYATMCIAHWILGIGDRHLENILISIGSGRSAGIDFASAFGSGIDQAIPELMPFRLTNQIQGLMKPFAEDDGFASTMIHVLRALRTGKGSLIAYLYVVTQENLNWAEHVNKLSQTIANEEWSGKMTLEGRKIQSVVSKLNGDKPSNITLEELKNEHYDGKYYPRYIEIVSGDDNGYECVRSQMISENNLTPEQQIQCLLDQATDLNVLGRTYHGWCPWM